MYANKLENLGQNDILQEISLSQLTQVRYLAILPVGCRVIGLQSIKIWQHLAKLQLHFLIDPVVFILFLKIFNSIKMCKVGAALFAIMKNQSEELQTDSGINQSITLGGCKKMRKISVDCYREHSKIYCWIKKKWQGIEYVLYANFYGKWGEMCVCSLDLSTKRA